MMHQWRLYLLIVCLLIPAGNALLAQTRSLSLELGGSAGLASINYEKAFREAANLKLAYRIGLSGFPIDRNSGIAFVLPFALQARWGTGPHKLETAMGFSLSFTTRVKFFSQAIPAIGYRYQASDKRLFYKIAYTPLISFLFNWQYQHWAGITIGYDL
ncbi:MAG: hypothetical protein AB8H47_04805 [Bacteroidia bacterium]